MNDGKYFEDYWLEIQRELEQYDTHSPSSDFDSGNSMSQNPDSLEDDTIQPDTYENLMDSQDKAPPTNDQMRASSRQDRIDAVRDFYNLAPTIINAKSIYKLHKTANRLYSKGYVKQANELVETADSLKKHFSLVEENDDFYKHLVVNQDDGQETIIVTAFNKNDETTNHHEFNDLKEAVKFFKSN